MNDFVEGFKQGLLDTPLLEWIAVVAGVAYVILAARRSIWCWIFAIISSAIYIYLCYIVQYYLESVLQVFFLVMGVVGWIMWEKSKNQELFVIKWPQKFHIINLSASTGLTLLLGLIFDVYTDQTNPYADAFTTVFSLTATFMVTKKVLNNWLYWIVIDIVAVFLYMARGYYLSSVLYFLFTILAIFGWMQWRKQIKLQQA